MPIATRLTVDAAIKMATAAANKHLSAPHGKEKPSADLVQAIAATWDLVKGRLGESQSSPLDALITKITGKQAKTTEAQGER